MKSFILSCFLFIVPVLTLEDAANQIADAIRTGNAKEVSKYFGANVDMKILDKEDVYSKAQAELILKDFFAKHAPKTFTVDHNGVSKSGAKFTIGKLVTSAGTYKTYFLLKKEGEKFVIQQFRIETDSD